MERLLQCSMCCVCAGLIFCQLPAIREGGKTGSSSQVESEEEEDSEAEEGSEETQPAQER